MKRFTMTHYKPRFLICMAVASLAAFFGPSILHAEETHPAISAAGIQPNIIKITANTSSSILLGRPDTDILELPSGRQMKLGDLRRFSNISQKLKTPPQKKSMTAKHVFKVKPKGQGIAIKNSSDLAAALKRSDTDTVALPSGRRATVGQIRFLEPYIEKRVGHKITQTRQIDNKANTLKIQATTDKAYWKNILEKPDNTILEAPDGTRITVGELKQTLATHKTKRSASTPTH